MEKTKIRAYKGLNCQKQSKGCLHNYEYGDRELRMGDIAYWDDKRWKVFAKSPQGMLTLKKYDDGNGAASIVLTPSQAQKLKPLIKISELLRPKGRSFRG